MVSLFFVGGLKSRFLVDTIHLLNTLLSGEEPATILANSVIEMLAILMNLEFRRRVNL